MGLPARTADCHPDRRHYGHGLCAACYRKVWSKTPKGVAAEVKKKRKRATCHPDDMAFARGLCNKCYRKWWRSENPERAREASVASQRRWREKRLATDPDFRRHLVIRKYKMTVQDYDDLLASQAGRCAGCGVLPAEGVYLQIDHCHDTGRVRGLLCGNCNSAIGYAKDDIERLRGLIRYLELTSSP